jgi:hypothetical protein
MFAPLRSRADHKVIICRVSPVALFRNIKRLKLDVAQHVPIHGNPGGEADFERIVGPVAARAPQQDDGV